MDNVNAVLQIVNALGIPLLAVGVILLIVAYQKSGEAYRDGSKYLRDENDRLRTRLAERDDHYFALVDRTAKLLARSERAIEELQARKIGLLASTPESDANRDLVLAEVKKINAAIESLQDLPLEFSYHLERELGSMTRRVAELAEEIGDVRARLAVVAVVTSPDVHEKLTAEISGRASGLVSSRSHCVFRRNVSTHSGAS